MRSAFGTSARDQLFAPGTEKSLRLLERSIGAAIRDFEPRVDVTNLRAEADPADPTHINVDIEYVIRATYVRGSLVFPFYVDGLASEGIA